MNPKEGILIPLWQDNCLDNCYVFNSYKFHQPLYPHKIMGHEIAIEHEKLLIECFVVKEKRDRMRALLQNKKARKKFRSQLPHSNFFDKRWMHTIPPNRQSAEQIMSLLINNHSPHECYIISESSSLDGAIMALDSALKKIVGADVMSIVSCIPGELIYVEDEGFGNRYILSKGRLK